jgi:hypothetical protein
VQATSTRRTPAAYGFGTSTRAATLRGDDVPGPGSYKAWSCIGEQNESTKKSAYRYTVRGREVFGTEIDHGNETKKPGPGHYHARVVNLNHRNQPHYSFSLNETKELRRLKTPGPGAYKQSSSIGKQLLSKNKHEVHYSFGKSTRDQGGITPKKKPDDTEGKLTFLQIFLSCKDLLRHLFG